MTHGIENETILGTNTQATSIYWTGSYYKDGSVNLNFSADLGYSVNIAKILNLGVNLDIEPSMRGETNEYTCDPYTRAAGLRMENTDKVYLKEDEQYLAVNINLSKVPDGANNNEDLFIGQTSMATEWKFDVYHDLDFIEYIDDAEVSVNYDVTN